jgi:putative transposase
MTGQSRTFFVTSGTSQGKSLLQTERMANLFIDVLRSYVQAKKFVVHDFVVMPNHVHILMTVPGDTSLEKAVQLIKGSFSFRARRELGFPDELWQRGFSDVRVIDDQSFRAHREYIAQNPVKAGLVTGPDQYPFGSAFFKKQKRVQHEALNP